MNSPTSISAGGQNWTLVAGLFSVLTVSSGLGFYNLSLYMNVLAANRAFSVAEVSGAVGVFFLAGGVAGLAVGRWLQHGDARVVMVAGALLGGTALALIGQVTAQWQLFVLYGLFGVGNTAVSLLPATTLVTRWFDARRRALALSITSTGLSLGGVLVTPLSVVLLESATLESAMALMGLCYALAIAPIAVFTIRSFPGSSVSTRSAPVLGGTPLGEARRSRFFIVVTASYVLLMGTQVGCIAHLYNRGAEVVGPIEASFAVALLASMSIVARLLGGLLLARVRMMPFTLVNMAGQAAGLALLAEAQGATSLWAAAAVFGCTVGNLLMLQPLLLAQAFGPRDYPRIFALSQSVTTLGVASGPVVMGIMHGVGGYGLVFWAAALASAVALALASTAGPMPRGELP